MRQRGRFSRNAFTYPLVSKFINCSEILYKLPSIYLSHICNNIYNYKINILITKAIKHIIMLIDELYKKVSLVYVSNLKNLRLYNGKNETAIVVKNNIMIILVIYKM